MVAKENLVYNNQQKDVFLNSSSTLRAWRLQDVYCRFEIRRTLCAAKDERHWLRFLKRLFIILFLRPLHSWIYGELFEI